MSTAPKSDAAIANDWPRFIETVRQRLESGRRVYGDSSFERPLLQVVKEIQAECEDIAGWGFLLWKRLDDLKASIEGHLPK